MRRRFSSHMAMAQHGGSWGFMGHARLTPIQPSCGCHQHWPAATIFQDLPSLEHDTVGRMWHVHFTMAVHTVVALHHPDWILSNYLFVSKKWNKSWENLHISLQTSKMLVWHPTIHWKQIPRRPSEKKKKTPALRQCLPDGLQSDPSLQRLPENILRALEEDHATKRWLVTLSPGLACRGSSLILQYTQWYFAFVWSNKD